MNRPVLTNRIWPWIIDLYQDLAENLRSVALKSGENRAALVIIESDDGPEVKAMNLIMSESIIEKCPERLVGVYDATMDIESLKKMVEEDIKEIFDTSKIRSKQRLTINNVPTSDERYHDLANSLARAIMKPTMSFNELKELFSGDFWFFVENGISKSLSRKLLKEPCVKDALNKTKEKVLSIAMEQSYNLGWHDIEEILRSVPWDLSDPKDKNVLISLLENIFSEMSIEVRAEMPCLDTIKVANKYVISIKNFALLCRKLGLNFRLIIGKENDSYGAFYEMSQTIAEVIFYGALDESDLLEIKKSLRNKSAKPFEMLSELLGNKTYNKLLSVAEERASEMVHENLVQSC